MDCTASSASPRASIKVTTEAVIAYSDAGFFSRLIPFAVYPSFYSLEYVLPGGWGFLWCERCRWLFVRFPKQAFERGILVFQRPDPIIQRAELVSLSL